MQGGGGATEVPEKFLQPIATGFPSIATLSSGVSEPKNTPDYADALVLALSARASVPIEALLADVVAAVQKPGQDYAGLLQTLAQFADLDVAELGQAMAEASALAGLAGRAEVIEETGA